MKPTVRTESPAPRAAWRRVLRRAAGIASRLGLAGGALFAPATWAGETPPQRPAEVQQARALLEARVALVRSALQADASPAADAGSPTAQWMNWPNWGNWNNWNNWPNWGNWGNWFNR